MNIGTNVTGITIPQGAVKNIKRGAEMLWQDGGLPTVFQRCEYIESHGTEWIDTKKILQENDDIKITANITIENNKGIFGSENFLFFVFIYGKNYFRIRYGDTGSADFDPTGWTATLGTWHSYQSVGKDSYLDGTFTGSAVKPFVLQTVPAYLFTANASSPVYSGKVKMKLAGFEWKRDNVHLIHFIPCYLKTAWNGIPAGTIGLYDRCGSISNNGTPFYTNEGAGTFTKGNDIL